MNDRDETDFTSEDNGKFRHPETVGGLPYKSLEIKVLRALDADVRTYPRIKEHCGLEKRFDLSPVIEGMELDTLIRRFENGTITAFFRYDQMPTRIWNNGDGTIGAEFVENFVPSKPRTLQDENEDYKLRQAAARQQAAEARANGTAPRKGPAPIELTENDVETAACENGSKAATAKALDIGYSTLLQKLATMPKLQEAYDRGLAEYRAANPSAKPESSTREPERVNQIPAKEDNDSMATTGTAMATDSMDFPARTPENIERLAAKYGSRKAVGHAIGLKGEHAGISLSKILNQNQDLKSAYQRGIAMYEAANPKAEKTVAPVAGKTKPARTELPDLERVEQMAADGYSKSRAAKELGIAVGTFDGLANGRGLEQRVKEASDRGIARRDPEAKPKAVEAPTRRKARGGKKKSKAKTSRAKVGKAAPALRDAGGEETPSPAAADDPRTVIEFKQGDLAPRTLGPPLEGNTLNLVPQQSSAADEPKPAPEEVREERSEPFSLGRSLAEKMVELVRIGAAHSNIRNKTHITFESGPDGAKSELLVAFDGNLFDLSPADREFVRHIIDLMQSYNDGCNAPAEAAGLANDQQSTSRWRRVWEALR